MNERGKEKKWKRNWDGRGKCQFDMKTTGAVRNIRNKVRRRMTDLELFFSMISNVN